MYFSFCIYSRDDHLIHTNLIKVIKLIDMEVQTTKLEKNRG